MYYKNNIIDISNLKNIKIYNNGYVYHFTRVWWNKETNHSDDDRISIGKLVDNNDKTKMYPNESFFIRFPDYVLLEEPGKIDSYLHSGAYIALEKSANEYNLIELLKKNFPKYHKKILALAISYIDNEDSTSQHYEKWAFSNYSGLDTSLTPSMINEIYNNIDMDSINDFLQDYGKIYKGKNNIKKRNCIAFDSTNQNTSSDISFAEYGHAKVDEGLPVINTAILVDEETNIPLYYEHFFGSLLDKSQITKSIEHIKNLGFERLFYMFDRGYFSSKSINSLLEDEFAIMTPKNNISANEIIDRYKRLIEDEKYYICDENIYGFKTEEKIEIGDAKLNVHMFYDPLRAADEKQSIHTKLSLMEKKLKDTKYYSKKLESTFEKYFKISKIGTRGKCKFTYTKKIDEINKEMSRIGMFIIVTNTNKSTNEIIMISRARDTSEKAFRRIKSHFDLAKPLVHNDKTFSGKMFVAFVALIIVEIFRYKIKDMLNKTSSETTFTILAELTKIIIYKKRDNTWALRYALTKKTKDVLSLLNINEKYLNDFIKKLNSSV